MSKMLQSSGAVAVATMMSRILGFLRESAYSGLIGTTPEASAFYLAFTIPNLLRRLLGEGALTAVFVPIFTQKERTDGLEATWRGAAAVVAAVVMAATVLVVAGMLVCTVLVEGTPLEWRRELMLRLLRVMLPYSVFVCTAAVFISMLNARGQFFLPALGAATMNIVMIGSVYLIAPLFGPNLDQQVYGLGVGVVISGLVQVAFQVPSLLRQGFRFRWVNPWKDPTVRETVKRLLPATIGVAAYQLNVVATQFIADSQAGHVVASFNYAIRLMELPQGVIGVSLATFLLTELSRFAADKKYVEFREALRRGMLYLVFVNGLATVLLVVLAEPMIRLLFQHGKFNATSTIQASTALMGLAPGLIAASLNSIVARAFFALDDTKTPMRIGVFCLALNLVLVLFLVVPFLQLGLAVANSISALTNTALLFYAFRRKMPKFNLVELGRPMAKMLGLAVLAGALAWSGAMAWEAWVGHEGKLRQAGAVFGPLLLASVAYLAGGVGLQMPEALELRDMLLRRRRRREE